MYMFVLITFIFLTQASGQDTQLTSEDFAAAAGLLTEQIALSLGYKTIKDLESSTNDIDPIAQSGKFEGDIVFPEGKDVWDFVTPITTGAPRAKSAIRNPFFHWADGVVPYVLPTGLSNRERQVIASAILEYSSNTCIKWQPWNGETDYVNIVKGTTDRSCASMVGRVGGRQDLNLGPDCFTKGVVIHEMMHSVGFYHEQSRADRDDYVNVLLDNVTPTERHNFDKYTLSHIDHLGTEYDCQSIMHYGRAYFSKAYGLETIVPKSDQCKNIGQRTNFSPTDIQDLNFLYNCKDKQKCSDFHDCCKAWAQQGECTKSREYMFKNCQNSCGVCTDGCYIESANCFNNVDTRCHGGGIYFGTKATTASGRTCQDWADNWPHEHDTYHDYPSNYCRDPDSDAGAWCYTTDPEVKWEYCFSPSGLCTDNCYNEFTGCFNSADPKCQGTNNYFGIKATTSSGKTCQVWAENSPHEHEFYHDLPNNYCRNVDSENGAWCYTMDPDEKWEYCFKSGDQCTNICYSEPTNCFNRPDPRCGGNNIYFGTKSTTLTGVTCQAWAENTPHEHDYYHDLPNNYCRDVDSISGAWCYTTDPNVKWEYCFEPGDLCDSGCYSEELNCFNSGHVKCQGDNIYFGTKATTSTGVACQAWSDNYPHEHEFYHELPSNYCRDFGSQYGAWCYTMDPDVEWEYCFTANEQC